MPRYSIQAIAEHVGGELVGPPDLSIEGVAELGAAGRGQLTFIGDGRYAARWATSQAAAALVSRDIELEPGDGRALVRVDNADLAMAQALELFAPPPPQPPPGVHPSAVVDPTATLGRNVCIGAHCVVGPRAQLGDGAVLHPHVTVLDDVRIGAGSVLWPGVVVRERCTIGQRCILHPNVVLGADGFGYRPARDGRGLVKIPQIGSVELGDDVELGAGTCIDRGKFAATTIGTGTKIDNLVQIGHNCRIGRHCVIAGHCGIAGSVTIGDGCQLGGMVAIKDHVTLGDGVRLSGCAQVMHDVPAGETWGGSPAQPLRDAVQQHLALRKLPDTLRQLKRTANR